MNTVTLRSFVLFVCVSLLSFVTCAGTRLGIVGGHFVVDGSPTFLLGASYYGGLGASPEHLRKDLSQLQADGFNWIRLWANWSGFANVSAFNADGTKREPYWDRLVALVDECDRMGMVVDLTLYRNKSGDDKRMLPDLASHRRAAENLTQGLRKYRNWYCDLANERDVRDARYVSFEDLRALRDAVKQLDPKRLVTASGVPNERNLKDYLETAGLDFIAPHLPRNPASPGQTEARVRQLRQWMKASGKVVPVQLQEPFRRGYTRWQPTAEDFLTDLLGARRGGAAGWCFHNGGERGAPGERPRRSFDLTQQRLFPQLDGQERRFIAAVRALHGK